MSFTGFTCKRIIERFINVRKIIVPQKYVYMKLGTTVLVSLGGVSLIPNVSAQSDSDMKNDTPDNEDEKHESEKNAGWERLKIMYQRDDYESLSRELIAVLQTTAVAFVCGCVYGGVNSSRIAFRDFMERNQGTLFDNHLDAKRRLQNHVTIHFGKGALRWGIKLAVFNAGFMFFLTSLLTYRGEVRVVDYMISGTLVGCILKFRLGPRGAVVGGTVGCLMGAVCGLATQGLFYLSGRSLDDIISYQYELDQDRLKLFRQIEARETAKTFDNKETLNLLKSHDGLEQLTKLE